MTRDMIAGVNLYLARGLNAVRRDVADLRERMARREGLFEGFAGPRPSSPGPV